jgi:hypothetical protein
MPGASYNNGYSKDECIFGSCYDYNNYYRIVFNEPGATRPVITSMAYAVNDIENDNACITIFGLKDKKRFIQAINRLYFRRNTCDEYYLQKGKYKLKFFDNIHNGDVSRIISIFLPPTAIAVSYGLPYYIYVHKNYITKLTKLEIANYEKEHPDVVQMHEDKIKIRTTRHPQTK